MGHEPLLAPLLTTHFFDGPMPALGDVQAILATSANGVRAFARLSPRRDLPLFAVGPQTAQAATDAGFALVRNAQGDARALARAACGWARRQDGALLHVSGEQEAGRLGESLAAGGFVYRKSVLYRVDEADAFPHAAAAALAAGAIDAALFFSPRSAKSFVRLAARGNLSLQSVAAVCISAATAEALNEGAAPGFAAVRIAARPDQDALLARLAG